MTTKEITYQELVKAIEISFIGDKDIFSLFDPNAKVKSVEEIVENISKKITEYNKSIYNGIFDKKELIGYFVYQEKMLISFALSPKYRNKDNLEHFFNLIKDTINTPFVVNLWKNNIRAIRWLLKLDLKIISSNNQIIKLSCQ